MSDPRRAGRGRDAGRVEIKRGVAGRSRARESRAAGWVGGEEACLHRRVPGRLYA